MKTIYFTIIFLVATIFSLQAQFLPDESYSPYSDSFASSSQNFSSAGDLNFGMDLNHFQLSTFNFPFSTYSPSEDWLVNLFGADYATTYEGWHILPYSDPDTGLKIPVGNGTAILTIVIGLYTIILFIRKKLRILRFA